MQGSPLHSAAVGQRNRSAEGPCQTGARGAVGQELGVRLGHTSEGRGTQMKSSKSHSTPVWKRTALFLPPQRDPHRPPDRRPWGLCGFVERWLLGGRAAERGAVCTQAADTRAGKKRAFRRAQPSALAPDEGRMLPHGPPPKKRGTATTCQAKNELLHGRWICSNAYQK